MRRIVAAIAAIFLGPSAEAQERPAPVSGAGQDMEAAAPALAAFTRELLFGEVWERAELASRDRSILTIAALIAGGRTAQMPSHFNRAIDNGVKPGEISAIITHLAFYSGWPNAVSAAGVARQVFEQRGIDRDRIIPPSGALLPIDPAGEARRAATVKENITPLAPALARYTDEVLFADLWRRPDLTPRDRSLATITALIATGEAEQLPFHLNRGLDNGLHRDDIAEIVTHLAFYAGWPKVMTAVPITAKVFAARGTSPAGRKAEAAANDASLRITRRGSQPSRPGAAGRFTGSVQIDSPFQGSEPARVGGATVSFEPGARTAWHTHPLGQTLIVTAGRGRVQREGGTIEEIHPGDIVWIPPGVKHWHGATPTNAMTHTAIAEALDGKVVDWMEHVTEEQYRRGSQGSSDS